MRIFIGHTFLKEFLSVLRHERFLSDFVAELRKKEHTLINIHIPYRKFRFMIGGVSLRGVVYLSRGTCLPLLIAKKSDKTTGYNLMWDTVLEKAIEKRMGIIEQEIKKREYIQYD